MARHSDWDQIGKSFTAVRGIGYVAWYPVATESANLSEGNSVFETVARWKARELEAAAEDQAEPVRRGCACNSCCATAKQEACDRSEQTGKAYGSVNECAFQPLGETVPLFVIGRYDATGSAAGEHFLLAGSQGRRLRRYALAAQTGGSIRDRMVWRAERGAEVKAEVVELNDPEAAPYESGSMLLTPLNTDSKMAQLTAVHQLTHAAFFSPRPWIYEGLAHFAQAVYRERESGRAVGAGFHGTASHRAGGSGKSAGRQTQPRIDGAGESLVSTSIEELYRSKAMYVWWMLRDMIGDDALKKALAAYRPDADDTTPSYMQHLIEAQTKRDLGWFFDDWVYHDRGLPDFTVASVYPWEAVGERYVVTVTLENLGNAGAEVPVILKMEQGADRPERLQVRGKIESHGSYRGDFDSLEIVVNDGSVPESDMSNNVYKIEVPGKKN